MTIGFNMPDANKDVLTGQKRWWTDAERTTEGTTSDPIEYLKKRVKAIRRVLTGVSRYNGPLCMEISQDLWEDMLSHSKALSRLAIHFYPTTTDPATRLAAIQDKDEDAFKEAIRKIIKVEEIKVRETYAYVLKPGVDENGEPNLVEERIDNFDAKNVAFVPTGRLGDIQGVQPLSMGYDADKVAYAMGRRLLIEQEDVPRTHSINVNGEMGQLCVPNAILHMYVSTVTA